MVASSNVKTPRQMLQRVLHWIKTRWSTTPTPDPEGLKFEFYSTAMNHYVVGRWATLAGVMPAYGNEFHLAVEMYLKGALVEKGFAPDHLRRFGHNLKRLWKAFKKHYDDGTLAQFDQLIQQLDRFEKIRYPDQIRKGLTMGISIGAGEQNKVWTAKPLPHYEVNLAEMDRLVRAIVEKASVNPRALMHRLLRQEVKDTLSRHNPEAGFWA
jgi:hypothetical protein